MNQRRSIVSALTVVGLSTLAVACGADANDEGGSLEPTSGVNVQGGGASGAGANGAAHAPDEVLVQWKRGVAANDKGRVRGKVSGSHAETIHTEAMKASSKGELEVVKLPAGVAVATALGALSGDPDVEFAEPNWTYQHTAVADDTLNASLWGMRGDATPDDDATPVYGSRADAAWAAGNTGSSSIYVGIIDEGYMFTHDDLAPNAGTNPGEIANNGLDDDNNGYVDDVNGWDFAANDKTVFDGVGDDHGTHVAGTIGAVGGNARGVAGMAWNVKLLSGKFLGARGGTTANAVKAVDYFTTLKAKGVNVVATNNSWGGGGFSLALRDAIARANAANILFVAAAGNETNDNDAAPKYPGNYDVPNVISVGALTSTGGVASFSNWGATNVDLFAPGVGIWSTVPVQTRKGAPITPGYASYNGTSMATPHVTGAVVLYAASHVGASVAEIKAALLSTAIPTASLAGRCLTGGRLNVASFVAPVVPPLVP